MQRFKALVVSLGVVLGLSSFGCSANKRTNEAPRSSEAPTAAAASAEASLPPPDPREKILSEAVLHLIEEQHLLRPRINDEVSKEAFETFIERLDAGKMFLLQSDRDGLAKYADKIDDQLRSGTLTLAHEGSRVFVERVIAVDKIVADLLAAPVDLSNEEWLELDAKKVKLATDEAQLKDRWRQRIELEVLERVATMELQLKGQDEANKGKDAKDAKDSKDAKKPSAKNQIKKPAPVDAASKPGNPADATPPADAAQAANPNDAPPLAQIPPTPEGREAKARADLAKSYSGRFARLRNPTPLNAAADLINAVAETIDPHTTYLPPADKANFDIRMTGSLQGIGAVLRERDHYVEVAEVVPGGASWRHGGVAAGDLILSVTNTGQEPVDVLDMHIDDVVKMVRGPKGTVVRLRLQKANGVQETVSITRDVVVIEEAYARGAELQRKGKPAVGYIHLPSFYGNDGRTASTDIRRILGELRTRKVKGIILDIRANGGGLLADAVRLTGEMIDEGPVVQVRDGRGRSEVLDDDRAGTDFDGPIVVLVDRFSASASEILAGALQDYGRAIIVGTGPTHGKGTVQTLADLDRITGGGIELGVLKLTIQQFFRVSGSSTQQEGVIPDIVLPDPAGYFESGERELPHAIAWSKVDPSPHGKWPVKLDLETLRKNSAARVAKSPILAKISAATAVLKTSREDTRVPLTRAAFDTRREQQRKALEAVSPDLKSMPAAFTVNVVGDSTAAASPDGKRDDSITRWKETLAHDPWVDECLSILNDVIK